MKMLMELDKVKSRMQDASRALQVLVDCSKSALYSHTVITPLINFNDGTLFYRKQITGQCYHLMWIKYLSQEMSRL